MTFVNISGQKWKCLSIANVPLFIISAVFHFRVLVIDKNALKAETASHLQLY